MRKKSMNDGETRNLIAQRSAARRRAKLPRGRFRHLLRVELRLCRRAQLMRLRLNVDVDLSKKKQ